MENNTNIIITKQCKKCHQFKPLNEYYPSRIKYGRFICIKCDTKYDRKKYRKNRQRTIAKVKHYHEQHKDEKLVYQNKYARSHNLELNSQPEEVTNHET